MKMTDGSAEASVLIRNFRLSDSDDLLALLPLCFAEEFDVSGFDPDRVKYAKKCDKLQKKT